MIIRDSTEKSKLKIHDLQLLFEINRNWIVLEKLDIFRQKKRHLIRTRTRLGCQSIFQL